MGGPAKLRLGGDELYGDVDPVARLSAGRPFRVEEEGDEVILVLSVPFADKSEVDVLRHGSELYITVGPYRRSFVLPDSLKRRHVRRARLADGELRVSFGLDA